MKQIVVCLILAQPLCMWAQSSPDLGLKPDMVLLALKNSPSLEKLREGIDIAKQMPPGEERDRLVQVLKETSENLKIQEAKHRSNVDYSFLGVLQEAGMLDWKEAELNKKTLPAFVKDITQIQLKDGRTVSMQSVTMLTPAGLRWIGEKIEETPWTNLPDDLAKMYGWSAERQRQYESWKLNQGRAASAQISMQKVALLKEQNASAGKAEALKEINESRVAVSLRVNQALPDGALCYGKRIESSSYWGKWVGLRWVNGIEAAEEHDEPIYVVGLPSTTVDGDRLAGWLYPCGVYRYNTVAGSTKTVRRYATTAEDAMTIKGL